jgi:hypothetical protein
VQNDLRFVRSLRFVDDPVQFDLREGRFSAQDASVYARANDPQTAWVLKAR